MQKYLKSVSIITMLATGVLAPSVSAQDENSAAEIEEILVTATKRSSTIKDVPFSINAQTEKDMQRSGAMNLEDVSRNVAGLMIQNLGPGQSQVAIRGVSAGQIVRDQPGVKEQVGVYLDESVISLSLFTPDIDLYDLNRIETLRGPQGTLFGSGSIGGTIRYITNQPDLDVSEGSLEANLNTLKDSGNVGGHIKGMVNIPMGDKAAIRVVAYHTSYAGFIDALGEDDSITKDVNSGSRTGGRVAIKFAPSENVTITPRVIYQEISADGFNRQEVFNLYANPHTTTRPAIKLGPRQQYLLQPEAFEDKTFIADLNAEIAFNGFDLTSVTSYTDRDILVSRDASALTGSVSVDLGYPDSAVMLPSNLRDTTDVKQFTQELRLSSNGDGALQWMVGGFYSNTDRAYQQFLPTPGYDAVTDAVLGAGTSAAVAMGVAPADSPYFSELFYSLEQIAVFAEVAYDINDKLQITAGGRYYDYKESRQADNVGLFGAGVVGADDPTASNGFTPRVMASYDVSEDVTLNAQISKGFRLGGVNDPLNIPLCSAEDAAIFGEFQDYDDESLWNYEVGAKVKKGMFSLNAAAFYTSISNLQVTLDAGSCSSRVTFNVDKAHSMGIEMELKAAPTDNFDIVFSGSLIESQFDSTVLDSNDDVLGGVRDGNRLPSVPKFSMGTTATYTYDSSYIVKDSEAYFSATYQYRGSIFTQPSDQEAGAGIFTSGLPFAGASGAEKTQISLELPSYGTLNLNMGLAKDNWEAFIYVNNVTDVNKNLSFDRERGGRARLGFRTNQPRTVGLTVRTRF
jgi:iron complex outermembrane recepter protein